jgi:AcrR family transcriptional regulator
MPRLSPARAAARRQQIIDAALGCFAESGFHKATLQDVVHACGLSPGSIYCHFASKEDIVYAVVEARHRRDLHSLELASKADSLGEALVVLANAFFPSPARREDRAWRRLAVQLWAESHHDATLLKVVRDGLERPLVMLADLLRKAQRRGQLGRALDPEPTARVLIAAFQGMTLQQTWDENIDARSCLRVIQSLLVTE